MRRIHTTMVCCIATWPIPMLEAMYFRGLPRFAHFGPSLYEVLQRLILISTTFNLQVPLSNNSGIYQQPPNPNIAEPAPFSAPQANPHDRYQQSIQQMELQKHQQMMTTSHRPRAFPFPGVPPSNVIDLDRIECGSDPRTTCMIKVSTPWHTLRQSSTDPFL